MMLVTKAPNDEDLRVRLKKVLGKYVIFAPIECGDVQVHGVWEHGEKCKLLFERKRLGDIINCIESGRYLAQWQNAREAGWERLYLYAEIERRFREGPKTGLVEVRRGRKWEVRQPEFEWYRIEAFLMEVEEYLGVKVVRTDGVVGTVRAMVRRHQLFQTQPEHHQTLHKLFTAPKPSEGLLSAFQKPSLTRRVAAQFKHIGWELSKPAEQLFGSVRNMVNASEEDWQEIQKIGGKIARDIVEELETDARPRD